MRNIVVKSYVGTYQLSEKVDILFNHIQASNPGVIRRGPVYALAKRIAKQMYPNTRAGIAFNMALEDILVSTFEQRRAA
jgi:hypothetical protein